MPFGGIIGWHKSFANVPALPASGKWVDCNGQVLADAGSPLNGQIIPNLNGAAGGADSPGHAAKVAMFLRGGVTSGTGQTDAFQGHSMALLVGSGAGVGSTILANSHGIAAWTSNSGYGYKQSNGTLISNIASDDTNGTPRTATETRPVNMSVVWIMRVK